MSSPSLRRVACFSANSASSAFHPDGERPSPRYLSAPKADSGNGNGKACFSLRCLRASPRLRVEGYAHIHATPLPTDEGLMSLHVSTSKRQLRLSAIPQRLYARFENRNRIEF